MVVYYIKMYSLKKDLFKHIKLVMPVSIYFGGQKGNRRSGEVY